MSDWYHTLAEDLKPGFMSLYNPTGAEPIPDSFLFNNSISQSSPVQAGKTYLIRLINISAFVGQYFWIEDYTMRIVEMDGVYVDEAEADKLYLSVAQRYAILVTMKNSTEKNYRMVRVADSSLLDTIPLNRVENRGRPKSRPGKRSESRRCSGCIASVFSPEYSDRIIFTFGSPVPRTSPKHHCPRPRQSPKPWTSYETETVTYALPAMGHTDSIHNRVRASKVDILKISGS
jgi:hypothetical protein